MKRNLSIFLGISICLSSALPSTIAFGQPKAHWALSSLENLQQQELLLKVPKDSVNLDKPLSSTHFESMLGEILGSPAAKGSTSTVLRKDTAKRVYSLVLPILKKNILTYDNNKLEIFQSEKDPVKWIQHTGIMKGYPDGNFKENSPLTVAQGVVIMKNIKDLIDASRTPNWKDALTPAATDIQYSFKALDATRTELILSWGEKPTGGYILTIDQVDTLADQIIVTFKATSPAPEAIVTQALTYPKASVTLDMPLETFKKHKLVLKEK